MAYVYVPESQPDSQPSGSQRNVEYTFEATQVSQPRFSQTQNTQNTTWEGSQVEPRRKYWATFIPTNSAHSIIKVPWTKPSLQLGRGAHQVGNDVVLNEKRVSNRHCRVTLGLPGVEPGANLANAIATSGNQISGNGAGMGPGSMAMAVNAARDSEAEPNVWIEDLGSSNGTFVNGEKITPRRLLRHGDEISLGHMGTLENHDVRYIFRSVGTKGSKYGKTVSQEGMAPVGEVYERYQILERLGKGTFAEVMRAVDVETGDMRAIKQIIKHRFAGNAKTLALFQREIEISSHLQHENICRLIEHYEDPQHICLVLEYIDGGDLLDHITQYPGVNGGGLSEAYAANLTLQICRAMAYTHAMGVTHRDLKPENILLTKEAPNNPSVIKIADFGLAKMVDAATMLKSMVGTPQYLAPEVVMQTKDNVGYENVVDSWSVGIIVYSMLTKALPFDEDPELPIEKRIRARFTQQFDTGTLQNLGITETAIDFIARLLAKKPTERMTMSEALEHEWLIGPSSQKSESQAQQPLGGDSMWSIESFDDYDDARDPYDENDEVELMNGTNGNGSAWKRPVTVSATNHGQSYPSSLAGESDVLQFGQESTNKGTTNGNENSRSNGNQHDGSIGRNDSSESFSQPMGNLRLDTPAHRTPAPMSIIFDRSPPVSHNEGDPNGMEAENIPEYLPASLPSNQIEVAIGIDQSPPSPPLTDVPCDLMSLGPGSDNVAIKVNTNTLQVNPHPSPLATPILGGHVIPSSLSNKRKSRNNPNVIGNEQKSELDLDEARRKQDPFFSSGSLSPPPPEEPDTPTKLSPLVNPQTPQQKPDRNQISNEQDDTNPRSTRRSARKSQLPSSNDPGVGDGVSSDGKKVTTRQSPRTARTRKSMRLS